MRRIVVTLLILLFSIQVNAEYVADLRLPTGSNSLCIEAEWVFSCASKGRQPSASPVESSSGSASSSASQHASHADLGDSITSSILPAYYSVARGTWQTALGPSFPAIYHPLFKPPPI